MPLYDIVFPNGDRSSTNVHNRIEPGAAIVRGRELFRVQGVATERGPAEPIRVDLQPWPAQKAILGRIYDVTDRR